MNTEDKSPRVYKPNGSKTGLVPVEGRVQTADATATVVLSFPVAEGEAIKINAQVLGAQSDYSDAVGSDVEIVARRAASGNVTVVGTPGNRILESDADTNVTIVANTTDQTVEIKVTGGAADETWNWEAFATYFKL